MDELRSKHKSIQSAAHQIALECIHPQSAHGSPYHVHPYPSPVRLQHAFQNSPRMFQPKGLKPHFDTRTYSTPNDSPILGRALCLTPRGSPVPGRVTHLSERFQDVLTMTTDTDALVTKIGAMFPTASETHIKILLKKYYNREAVVISALQVEKHPIATPGPLSMSPSAARLHKSAMGVYSALQLAKGVSGSSHFTPLTGTPQGSPSLRRPASGASSYYGTTRSMDGPALKHSHSPKMKLKYLKSIFPKAEETLILDVLANKDNNVQKASEELITMGFPKKETVIHPQKKKEKETPQPPKKVVTIMKTLEEKKQLRIKLQNKYKSIAERVITIALESVDYNEERAEQILDAVLCEENSPKTTKTDVKQIRKIEYAPTKKGASPVAESAPAPPLPASRRLKMWADNLKAVAHYIRSESVKILSEAVVELFLWPILKSGVSAESKFKSQYAVAASGPNVSLRQGPKDNLLLEDYMAWNGPNPEFRSGQTLKAEGPETRASKSSSSLARGPAGLARGSASVAKGSIYQKLTKKSAKIAA